MSEKRRLEWILQSQGEIWLVSLVQTRSKYPILWGNFSDEQDYDPKYGSPEDRSL
jgi:hypothetical protein